MTKKTFPPCCLSCGFSHLQDCGNKSEKAGSI